MHEPESEPEPEEKPGWGSGSFAGSGPAPSGLYRSAAPGAARSPGASRPVRATYS